MEPNIEDIAGLVRGLNIAVDAAPRQHLGEEPIRSAGSHPVSLQAAIHRLIQSTAVITSQAESVKSLADDANSRGNLPVKEVCSLREGITKLSKVACNVRTAIDALNEATERSVITGLKSLGIPSSEIPSSDLVFNIFSHFDKEIKNIVREVLNNTSDQEVFWRVAEECYKQITSGFRYLHADNYFAALDGASLAWPYDPDLESEEYYEHENRLDVDENYSAAFQRKIERRLEARKRDEQSWTDFWITVLKNSPSGPTLFYPPASSHIQSLNLIAVPNYLFRTFDAKSSGWNDENVIGSMASIIGSQGNSRIDILRRETHIATELLHMHLDKSCFDAEESDNLMSWTSSLLFAIQYAIWRCRIRKCHPSEIKICAVDTRNFPQGQFAQDIWLLKAYHATAKRLGDPIRRFFDFRLEREDFYNGEYLSQGALNHKNRSCIISLEQLIQAGLFQLYPEFEDARGSEQWTNRVRELRWNWSEEQGTTDREIQLALGLARDCFTRFEPSHIASTLLTFKNRKCTVRKPTNHFGEKCPEWADKPIEVRRYWIATKGVKSSYKRPYTWMDHLQPQHQTTVREIFE